MDAKRANRSDGKGGARLLKTPTAVQLGSLLVRIDSPDDEEDNGGGYQ